MSLLRVALYFLMMTLPKSLCEVTSEIKSKVAINGTYVDMQCAGLGEPHLQIDHANFSETLSWSNMPKTYPQYHINVSRSEEEINSKTIRIIEITVYAEVNNNGTNFKCTFQYGESDSTGPATLYVAKDELGGAAGFQSPTVSYSTNRRTMNIAWSPPWSHLVNSYTVTVNNKTSNEWTEYDITDNGEVTEWSMDVNSTYSDCQDLALFITAYTDVGTAKSNIALTAFPIELRRIQESDVSIQFFQTLEGKLRTEIGFEAPIYCPNSQEILYNYSLYDHDHPYEMRQFGPFSITELALEEFIKTKGNYRLEVSYWDTNAANFPITVTKYFYTNFSIPLDGMIVTTTTAAAVNNTSTSIATSTCTTKNVYQSSTSDHSLVYITVATFGVLFALLTVCVVVIIVLVVVLRARRRTPRLTEDVTEIKPIEATPNNDSKSSYAKSSSTIKPAKRERKASVPQMMATNPLYEGCSTLYAYLPDPEDLKGLNESKNLKPQIRPQTRSDISLEIPPQLPPPRKMSLDSPGIKNGVQLSLDKRIFLRQEIEGVDSNEEYVAMKSIGESRYAKSPVMRLKLEETTSSKMKMPSKESRIVDNKEQCNMDKI